jgi:hypothetical protein
VNYFNTEPDYFADGLVRVREVAAAIGAFDKAIRAGIES